MSALAVLDTEAIARACERHGVAWLRLFGSAVSDRFDVEQSDMDFLMDFAEDRDNMFHDFIDLKVELESIVGRPVDLVVARSVTNPFFKATAFGSARDVYAAWGGRPSLGMRNAIAHEYGELDYEIVWRAVTLGVPPLLASLGPLASDARRRLDAPDPESESAG